jgi:hypothetical protein
VHGRTAWVFLPRSTRWIVGVDLGQSSDPTAIAVLEHVRGVLDSGSALERHCGLTADKQKPGERMDVRHLERLPLGTSYPVVVQHVKTLLSRPPLCGDTRIKPAEGVRSAPGSRATSRAKGSHRKPLTAFQIPTLP